jgi:hypothetical protein
VSSRSCRAMSRRYRRNVSTSAGSQSESMVMDRIPFPRRGCCRDPAVRRRPETRPWITRPAATAVEN